MMPSYHNNTVTGGQVISWIWELWYMITPDDLVVNEKLGRYHFMQSINLLPVPTSLENVSNERNKIFAYCFIFMHSISTEWLYFLIMSLH
jgi:hypothetical protein